MMRRKLRAVGGVFHDIYYERSKIRKGPAPERVVEERGGEGALFSYKPEL